MFKNKNFAREARKKIGFWGYTKGGTLKKHPRAKRAIFFWDFKAIYKGKPLKTGYFKGLKSAKSGLLAGPDFGNMKTLFQTFGRILKI